MADEILRRPAKDHFPVTVVWCPIPLLTWLLPFIGHLGIVKTDGTIHDFAGPYFVNRDHGYMGFGRVTKFIEVDPSDLKSIGGTRAEKLAQWDAAIDDASASYDKQMHNLFCNNCHDHVSLVLNRLRYMGFSHWNTVTLILYAIYKAKFVSVARFLITYGAFLVLAAIGVTIFLVFRFK